jgi:hypothetical protein
LGDFCSPSQDRILPFFFSLLFLLLFPPLLYFLPVFLRRWREGEWKIRNEDPSLFFEDIALQSGKVAIGVEVSPARAVGGMIKRGDFVNLIAVIGKERKKGIMFLQKVRVLDVRSPYGMPLEEERRVGIVVLELLPEEATLLAALSEFPIHFCLTREAEPELSLPIVMRLLERRRKRRTKKAQKHETEQRKVVEDRKNS